MHHIHILEPRADGHRMQYVRRILAALAAQPDISVSLHSFAGHDQHEGFRAACAAGGARFEYHVIEGRDDWLSHHERGSSGLRLQPFWWRTYKQWWDSVPSDKRGEHIIVPYLDALIYACGVFGSPFGQQSLSGICMRQDFHWQHTGVSAPPASFGGLKRWSFTRSLRSHSLQTVFTIDPSLVDWAGAKQPKHYEKLCYIDDPSDISGPGDRADARAHWGLAEDDTVLLMFGAIDLRKGLKEMLAFLAQAQAQVKGLIVGSCSDAAREMIANYNATEKLTVVDRYVDSDEEYRALIAADFGWLCYTDFYGPSGFLAQCRQADVIPIHNGLGVIGRLIQDFPHAVHYDTLMTDGLPKREVPQFQAPDQAFGNAVIAPILKRLGLAGD